MDEDNCPTIHFDPDEWQWINLGGYEFEIVHGLTFEIVHEPDYLTITRDCSA